MGRTTAVSTSAWILKAIRFAMADPNGPHNGTRATFAAMVTAAATAAATAMPRGFRRDSRTRVQLAEMTIGTVARAMK